MLQTLLGPEVTWSLECALIDAILELTSELDRIVGAHENLLQLDEQELCRSLGITNGRHLCYI